MLPDHIIIDFDSTFIAVESLDELATYKFSNNENGKNLIRDIQLLMLEWMEILHLRSLLIKG